MPPARGRSRSRSRSRLRCDHLGSRSIPLCVLLAEAAVAVDAANTAVQKAEVAWRAAHGAVGWIKEEADEAWRDGEYHGATKKLFESLLNVAWDEVRAAKQALENAKVARERRLLESLALRDLDGLSEEFSA